MQARLSERINERDLNLLYEDDNRLRELLEDLTTIREWWTNNRKEWDLRRREIQKIQTSIDSLLVQLGGKENIQISPHAATRSQYYLQVELSNSRLEWFRENEDYLALVVERYRTIEARTQNLASNFRRSPFSKPWTFVDGFDFDVNILVEGFDKSAAQWWKYGRGYPQVASNTRGYLEETMEDDRIKFEMRRESLIMVQKALSDANYQSRAHRDLDYIDSELAATVGALQTNEALQNDPRGTAASRAAAAERVLRNQDYIRELKKSRAVAEVKIAANADYVKSLQNTSARLTLEPDILFWERERNGGIRDLAKRIDGDTVGRTTAFFRQHVKFIQNFYMICRVYHNHQNNSLELLTTLQDEVLQQSDRETIITLVEGDCNNYLQSRDGVIVELARAQQNLWNEADLLDETRFEFEYQYEDMVNIVEEAARLLRERKTELAVVPPP